VNLKKISLLTRTLFGLFGRIFLVLNSRPILTYSNKFSHISLALKDSNFKIPNTDVKIFALSGFPGKNSRSAIRISLRWHTSVVQEVSLRDLKCSS
jgi:hypothetical protein